MYYWKMSVNVNISIYQFGRKTFLRYSKNDWKYKKFPIFFKISILFNLSTQIDLKLKFYLSAECAEYTSRGFIKRHTILIADYKLTFFVVLLPKQIQMCHVSMSSM